MSKRSMSGDVKMTRTVSYAPAIKSRTKQYVKRKYKGSAALRSVVRQQITKLAEKKMVLAGGANVPISCVTGTVPVSLTLTPSLAQGTGQNQRVGNAIRVTNSLIRGHFALLPFNATTNTQVAPVMLKVWICRYKPSNTASLSSTTVATNFFDTGVATTGFTGSILDLELFPNVDAWDVLQTKTYKLGGSSTSANQPVANTFFFDNSSAILPFEFNLTPHLRGQCLYQDNASNDCTNKSLFMVMQTVFASGVVATAQSLCEIHYAYMSEYIDI